jgi:hypothetical protein
MKRLYILTVLTALAGCTFNADEYEIKSLKSNPELALPLAVANLTIEDLLDQTDSTYVHVYEDGLVYLGFSDIVTTHDIRNLVHIPNLGVIRVLNIPAATYPPSNTDVESTVSTSIIDMGISPEKLTEIVFKTGTLNYVITTNNNSLPFAVKARIVEYKKETGDSFLEPGLTGSGALPIDDYTFQSATPNKFTLELTLIIKAHPNTVIIPPGSSVSVQINYSNVDFESIKGFFDDQIADPGPQTINVSTFGEFRDFGDVSFADPKIYLDVITDYVVPLEVTFTTFEARKDNINIPVLLDKPNPISIDQPLTLGSQKTTRVSVTNASELIAFDPTHFYFDVSGHINNGLTSGVNYMADTSQMRVRMSIELPLYGKASDIILSDTSSLDLRDLNETEIENASLNIMGVNELPLDAYIQVYLLDRNDQVLTVLIEPSQTYIVKGSQVDADGEPIAFPIINKTIDLSSDKLKKLFEADKFVLVATLNTSKNDAGTQVNVKFKSDLKIQMRAKLNAKLKVKVDL